jgi:hypothetical protein
MKVINQQMFWLSKRISRDLSIHQMQQLIMSKDYWSDVTFGRDRVKDLDLQQACCSLIHWCVDFIGSREWRIKYTVYSTKNTWNNKSRLIFVLRKTYLTKKCPFKWYNFCNDALKQAGYVQLQYYNHLYLLGQDFAFYFLTKFISLKRRTNSLKF